MKYLDIGQDFHRATIMDKGILYDKTCTETYIQFLKRREESLSKVTTVSAKSIQAARYSDFLREQILQEAHSIGL